MECDKCNKDSTIKVILEVFDENIKNWKTFHLCGINCLITIIKEDIKIVGKTPLDHHE